MKAGIYLISSHRFIEGIHSVLSSGSMCKSKSRPSARELGSPKAVLVITRGGWNGNLSLSKMSKLNFSKGMLSFASYFTALESISSCKER
jgi:hypothetical protein